METVSCCPACGVEGKPTIIPVPDHEYGLDYQAPYAHCPSCGTAYQQPMPTFAALASFYPESYHSKIPGGRLKTIRNDMRIKRLLSVLPFEGAVCDFGCGDGSFLKQFAEARPDLELFGYEIDATDRIVRIPGSKITLVYGRLEQLFELLPQCAMITLNHVIEHLPDPLSSIRSLREKLAEGGIIEGQTPAANSLEHRLFGTKWSGYHAPRHTVVFSAEGLQALLRRAELKEVSTVRAFNVAGLAVTLGSIPHGDEPGIIHRAGFYWLWLLGWATLLSPFDQLSGRWAIMDFSAKR